MNLLAKECSETFEQVLITSSKRYKGLVYRLKQRNLDEFGKKPLIAVHFHNYVATEYQRF